MSYQSSQDGAPPVRDLILDLPARAENVVVARHAVRALAQEAGLFADSLADVILAVGEACANAVVHAYRDADPTPTDRLLVRGRVRDGELQITIRDRGCGLAPRSDSPGLGLGLPLMASLSSHLQMTAAEGGGTEILMTFPVPVGGIRSDASGRTVFDAADVRDQVNHTA